VDLDPYGVRPVELDPVELDPVAIDSVVYLDPVELRAYISRLLSWIS
jgi:hypothetical protein